MPQAHSASGPTPGSSKATSMAFEFMRESKERGIEEEQRAQYEILKAKFEPRDVGKREQTVNTLTKAIATHFQPMLEDMGDALQEKMADQFQQKLDKMAEALEGKMALRFEQKLNETAESTSMAMFDSLSKKLESHTTTFQNTMSSSTATITEKITSMEQQISGFESALQNSAGPLDAKAQKFNEATEKMEGYANKLGDFATSIESKTETLTRALERAESCAGKLEGLTKSVKSKAETLIKALERMESCSDASKAGRTSDPVSRQLPSDRLPDGPAPFARKSLGAFQLSSSVPAKRQLSGASSTLPNKRPAIGNAATPVARREPSPDELAKLEAVTKTSAGSGDHRSASKASASSTIPNKRSATGNTATPVARREHRPEELENHQAVTSAASGDHGSASGATQLSASKDALIAARAATSYDLSWKWSSRALPANLLDSWFLSQQKAPFFVKLARGMTSMKQKDSGDIFNNLMKIDNIMSWKRRESNNSLNKSGTRLCWGSQYMMDWEWAEANGFTKEEKFLQKEVRAQKMDKMWKDKMSACPGCCAKRAVLGGETTLCFLTSDDGMHSFEYNILCVLPFKGTKVGSREPAVRMESLRNGI